MLEELSRVIWGPGMIALFVGTGIFLSFRLRFAPQRNLGKALRRVFSRKKGGKGDISPFQALMTSLAATVGTGNIVGVATAMTLGGAGAIFWMLVSSFFGMATSYAENLLAVKYRIKNHRGEMAGGPMYTLQNGLRNKKAGRFLGCIFAILTVIASFGVGNLVQSNSASAALSSTFALPSWVSGAILCILSALIILGGIKNIGRVCSLLIPFAAGFYMLCCVIILIVRAPYFFDGISLIFYDAFSLDAMAGGAAGTVLSAALRYGIARGVFTNEAGLGSAPIAASAAQSESPAIQGSISMTGVFFDTFVVCTMTALVLSCTGALSTGLTGVNLTIYAFSTVFPGAGSYIVGISLCLFAFSTILGWSYYGEKSLEFLSSSRLRFPYRLAYCLVAGLGAVLPMSSVWALSDIANALMAVPNLLSLLLLSSVVVYETKKSPFFSKNTSRSIF